MTFMFFNLGPACLGMVTLTNIYRENYLLRPVGKKVTFMGLKSKNKTRTWFLENLDENVVCLVWI